MGTNEFKVFSDPEAAKYPAQQMMYSLEESTCCWRYLCKSNRPYEQTMWLGTKENLGGVVMKMTRPCACPMQPCCCCSSPPFMQTIDFKMGDDSPLGQGSVPCFTCVPSIMLTDATGAPEFNIQMPTCCGGLCVNCMAEGCCNCKVPFYIYLPGTPPTDGNQVGKIVKHWRGLGSEIFTDATSFQVEFPLNSSVETKARLMGITYFVNILFF